MQSFAATSLLISLTWLPNVQASKAREHSLLQVQSYKHNQRSNAVSASTDSSLQKLMWITPHAWFQECAVPFAKEGYGFWRGAHPYYLQNHSNYDFYKQPHGLCMDNLACAYQECAAPSTDQCFGRSMWYQAPTAVTFNLRVCPPDNLPLYVMPAESVEDVIAGIQFARRHGMKVSVKTTGHSYTGSSTLERSVNINMARYPKYSKFALTECVLPSYWPPQTANELHMCSLARARKKTAVVRVGAGEIWDEVYASVHWYPSELIGKRYHIVGGGAGTVSAIGGWMQGGGLSGTTGMRIYGFGVDQVLQIEMVLSNGRHVRLSPSEWETVPGKLYPQTVKVTGECNENPVADESKWIWKTCEDAGLKVAFRDLWFAVRGGGGGTYGVVTSVYYQLHDQKDSLGYQVMIKSAASVDHCTSQECHDFLRALWLQFSIDFFFPEGGQPWENVSKFCGSASAAHLDIYGSGLYHCNDNSTGWVMASVWQSYVDGSAGRLQGLGLNSTDLHSLKQMLFSYGASPDAYSSAMYTNRLTPEWMKQHPNRFPDAPPPALFPDNLIGRSWTALLPKAWIHTDRAKAVLLEFVKKGGGGATYILGAETAVADDGLCAVPTAQREASFMVYVPSDLEDVFRESMDQYIGGNSLQNKTFPGGAEYNHISASEFGPLKADWTKTCPDTWTDGQRRKHCVSIQEAVWGTSTLNKLGTIKKLADPGYLFQCFDCVGFQVSWPAAKHMPVKEKSFPMSHRWCVQEEYGGTCTKWVSEDPAKKLR